MPLKNEPTAPKLLPMRGRIKKAHSTFGLGSNIMERALEDPAPLAEKFTNFRQDFSDPIKVPNGVNCEEVRAVRAREGGS